MHNYIVHSKSHITFNILQLFRISAYLERRCLDANNFYHLSSVYCILHILYMIAYCIQRFVMCAVHFTVTFGDCNIFLTKYDLCVYSLMMAACISHTCVTVHPGFEGQGGIFEIWFVARVLKQRDERLHPHPSTWSVVKEGELHIHG